MQASMVVRDKPGRSSPWLRAFGLDTDRLSSIQKLILLTCLTLTLTTVVRSFADVRDYAGIDLRNRVVGARVMLAGRDPYTFFWRPGMPEEWLDPAHDWKVHRLTVPPTTLWLYAPLAPLPYRQIRVLSCLLEWLALAVSLGLLVRLVPGTQRRVYFLAIAVVFFVAGDFWRMHLERGQVYVFHLLALSFGAYYCRGRNLNSWGAGVAFGIAAAMRPNLALLAPAFLILGKWRTGLGTGLTCGSAVLLSAIASPAGIWQSYLQVGNAYYVSIWAREALPDIPLPQTNGIVEGYDFAAHLRDLVVSTSFAVLYQRWRQEGVLPGLDLGMLSKGMMAVISVGLLALLFFRRRTRYSPRIALALILSLALDVEFFLPQRWAYVDVVLLVPLALLAPRLLAPRTPGKVTAWLVAGSLVAALALTRDHLFVASLIRAYGVMGALAGLAIWSWARAAEPPYLQKSAVADSCKVS